MGIAARIQQANVIQRALDFFQASGNFPAYLESLNPWGYLQLDGAPTSLDSYLQAYYELDENAGAVASDATGNGYTADIFPAGWTPDGFIGSGMLMDGATVFADSPGGAGLSDLYTVTIGFWYKYVALPTGVLFEWSPNYNDTSCGFLIYADVANNGVIEFDLHDNIGPWHFNVNYLAAPFDGQWHRYVAVLDFTQAIADNQVQVWLDGVQQVLTHDPFNNQVCTGPIEAGDTLYIGARAGASLFCTGILDEIATWAYALPSSLITADYNAGAGQRPILPVPISLDSASPTQLTPNGHAWDEFAQPPPNNEAWNNSVVSVPGLVSDSRTAVKPSGSGAMCAVAWDYTADAPMQASGWWILFHVEPTALPGGVVSDVWIIPIEDGFHIQCQIGNDGSNDYIQLLEDHGGTKAKWTFATGTLTTGKHEIIVRSPLNTVSVCTLWLDGVDQGNHTYADDTLTFLSQGFQVGGALGAGASFTIQDVLIMPIGYSPGNDVTDLLATLIYEHWIAAGG
jgi:hypothetical protein